MSKRTYRSKSEWRKLIEQQAQSGLSGLEFCQQQGLLAKTFYRHRKLLRQQNLIPVRHSFVQVQPKAISPVSSDQAVILQHRESRVSIPSSTDPVWLAQLMNTLR
ncbi:MAG: hypothetical protein OEY09_17035 [Gammaproteobacteria bacterium]|nr:hypothetical protein [Gammaproteobacteria bacterium]